MKNGLLYSLVTLICMVFLYSNMHAMYPIKLRHIKTSSQFRIDKFFDGELHGWGAVYNAWNHRAVGRFALTVKGDWSGNSGRIMQYIGYEDGTTEAINWSVALNDGHNFGLYSEHIIEPVRGRQYGANAEFSYRIYKRLNNKVNELTYVTNLVMINESTALATVDIKKYGVVMYKIFATLQSADIHALKGQVRQEVGDSE